MTKNHINLKDLLNLLSRFFDKVPDIPDRILTMAGKFIFDDAKFTELGEYPELLDTLEYLKDVKQRNNIKELNDLIQYYVKKQNRIDDLFDRFEESDSEENFALNFQGACKTYLKVNCIVYSNKSDGLYYPIIPESNYVAGFENISYADSFELEKRHLAQVKGNMLIKQQSASCISYEKTNPLVSN